MVLIGFGIWWAFAPQKKKTLDIDSVAAKNGGQPKSSNWVWPIIIAIALAFWSVIFALFFLAIVWVMRLNPDTEASEISSPSDKDRKRAMGTYTWLLLSPMLNVFILLILVFNAYSPNASTNEWVIVALAPLLIHLPVLFRLDSNSPFVFRHTQQAIFLLALRASMTALALNIGSYPEDGIWLFLLGNGSLWLFGSFWGRGQAYKGKGWWIKQKGEQILGKDNTASPTVKDKDEPLQNTTPEKHIEYGKWYLKNNRKDFAQKYALEAFRSGKSNTRRQAIDILHELGEVEKF